VGFIISSKTVYWWTVAIDSQFRKKKMMTFNLWEGPLTIFLMEELKVNLDIKNIQTMKKLITLALKCKALRMEWTSIIITQTLVLQKSLMIILTLHPLKKINLLYIAIKQIITSSDNKLHQQQLNRVNIIIPFITTYLVMLTLRHLSIPQLTMMKQLLESVMEQKT